VSLAYQLRLLRTRVFEAATLFHYRSRTTEDDFGESAYRWPDRRGRHFVLTHVNPQVGLFEGNRAAIRDLGQCMELACRHGEVAEERITEVRGLADEVHAAEAAALRLSASAEALAGVARSRARDADDRARRVGGSLGVLGGPPV
jgi:hypothetical protein